MLKVAVAAMVFALAGCGASAGNLGARASPSMTPTPQIGGSPSATTSSSASPSSGFSTPREAALDGAIKQTGAIYLAGTIDTCPAQQKCLTIQSQVDGTNAAYFRGWLGSSGGFGGVCFIYTIADSGWHFLDIVCAGPESGVSWPDRGEFDYVQITGGGCANVRDTPSLRGRVVACLPAGTTVTLDDGPNYVVEPQPSGQASVSHVWWHISGKGWIVHDFLVPATS